MRDGLRVREITNEEGNRLLRIVRRFSGSVATWRRAQMVLLSAQGMDVARIARVAFTSPDRVRAVIHNFDDDGFDSPVSKYADWAEVNNVEQADVPTNASWFNRIGSVRGFWLIHVGTGHTKSRTR